MISCDVRVRLLFFLLARWLQILSSALAHSQRVRRIGPHVTQTTSVIGLFFLLCLEKNQNLDGICYIESATAFTVRVDLKGRVAFCQSYMGHTFY